jgi:hypothetical protein
MAIVANLPRAIGRGGVRKLFVGTAAITGTGSIITGLATIDPGSAMTTCQNSATTIPTNIATVSGVVNGPGGTATVSIVVVALQSAANAISTVAATVGLLCTGS